MRRKFFLFFIFLPVRKEMMSFGRSLPVDPKVNIDTFFICNGRGLYRYNEDIFLLNL